MKNLITAGIACSMLALASCGGSDDATTITPSSNSSSLAANTTIVANTGTLTVTVQDNYGFAYQGAIVSIGASGAISATSNASGQAVFNGLSAGAQDVHIFDAVSNTAESIYALNSNAVTIQLANADTKQGSWIDVNMSIINSLAGVTQTYALKTTNKTYQGAITANGVSFFVADKKAGTAITGEILVGQGNGVSTSNNTVSGGMDEIVNLGSQTLTTTATSTTSANSFVATFSATVVTPANLVTINASSPASLPLVLIQAGLDGNKDVFSTSVFPGAGMMTIADTIQAADSQAYRWKAVATNNTGGVGDTWAIFDTFTVGSTVSTSAQFSSAITAQSPQSGTSIAWANAASNSPMIMTVVTLADANSTTLWDISVPAGVSSVVLPTVPTAATSPLTVGTTYTLNLMNIIVSGISYEQGAVAGGAGLTKYEVMLLTGGSFTR